MLALSFRAMPAFEGMGYTGRATRPSGHLRCEPTCPASLNPPPRHELDQPPEHFLSALNIVRPLVPDVCPHADVVCDEVASPAHEFVGLNRLGLAVPEFVGHDDSMVVTHSRSEEHTSELQSRENL